MFALGQELTVIPSTALMPEHRDQHRSIPPADNAAVPRDALPADAPTDHAPVQAATRRNATARRRPWPDARKTWIRENWFGLDSIQGILEIAEWYPSEVMTWVAGPGDREDPYHPLGMLRQLEEEGLVKTTWRDYPSPDGQSTVALDKIWLTTKGHEKLRALRQQSRSGQWKARLSNIVISGLTALVTTLVTLYAKSCAS